MRFCRDCNNMLYPRDNPSEKVLEFFCRNCQYSEIARDDVEDNCVYKNEIKLSQTSVKIDPSIVNDPTYSRTTKFSCNKCGFNETIFFQNPNLNDSGMKLIFVCCGKSGGAYCGNWWYNN